MERFVLKDKLQILLITYNRKRYLKETFEQIFAESSPIRDFDITVLDNASTDGTSELIQEYKQKFQNIEHIRHQTNIGGNANICRAIELALVKNKEYFWILCDDDYFNFQDWNDVEKGVNNQKDIIVVSHVQKTENVNKYNIINELTFVPSAIYKTSVINETVILNAYMNIYNTYPHSAIVCYLINKGELNFSVINQQIVVQNWYRTILDFQKGTDAKFLHHKQKHIEYMVAFINTYKMINDKKYRYKCNENLWLGKSFFYSAYRVWQKNKDYFPNLLDFFLGISFAQKIQFILVPIFGPVYYKLKYICKFLYLSIVTDIIK